MKKDLKPKVVKIEEKAGYQRLLVPEKDALKMKSGCVTLNPGEAVGAHSTEFKEEAILVLRGEAEISCGKDTLKAREREMVYMPPKTEHNVKNIGQDILQYVFIVVPI